MIDPKIIVAIDTYDYEDAIALLDQLNPELCKVKIGSVLFNALACLWYLKLLYTHQKQLPCL